MKKYSLLLVILPCFLASVWVTAALAEMVSVKGDNVNLRKGPGTNYEVLWEYGNDFPLRILEKKGQWVKVQDFENDTGWIHSSLLHHSPQVIVKVNRNKDTQINIRKGPGTTYDIVAKAYYGVVFKTLSRKNGWIEVEHESGLKGWIKGTLVWGY